MRDAMYCDRRFCCFFVLLHWNEHFPYLTKVRDGKHVVIYALTSQPTTTDKPKPEKNYSNKKTQQQFQSFGFFYFWKVWFYTIFVFYLFTQTTSFEYRILFMHKTELIQVKNKNYVGYDVHISFLYSVLINGWIVARTKNNNILKSLGTLWTTWIFGVIAKTIKNANDDIR